MISLGNLIVLIQFHQHEVSDDLLVIITLNDLYTSHFLVVCVYICVYIYKYCVVYFVRFVKSGFVSTTETC